MDTSKYIMDSKKSLGYSPLGIISHEESQFDFIADRNPVAEPKKSVADGHVSRLVEERPSPISSSIPKSEKNEREDIFSEFFRQKSDHGIFNIPREAKESAKKSASYYMSTETIQRLREYADKNDETYSSIAEKAIKAYLHKID